MPTTSRTSAGHRGTEAVRHSVAQSAGHGRVDERRAGRAAAPSCRGPLLALRGVHRQRAKAEEGGAVDPEVGAAPAPEASLVPARDRRRPPAAADRTTACAGRRDPAGAGQGTRRPSAERRAIRRDGACCDRPHGLRRPARVRRVQRPRVGGCQKRGCFAGQPPVSVGQGYRSAKGTTCNTYASSSAPLSAPPCSRFRRPRLLEGGSMWSPTTRSSARTPCSR